MWMIWTDGSCLGNPGVGGWGVVVVRDGEVVDQRSGGDPATTNNRMEMTAAVEGLRAVPARSKVVLHSDSQLLIKGMTEWMRNWQRNNFKGGHVKNIDLWQLLLAQCDRLADVRWRWVRGHSTDEMNCLADKLATEAAANLRHLGTRPHQKVITEQRLDDAPLFL